MPFFDQYPYTNFHNVNLDWILQRVKEWGELVEQNNAAFHNLEEANESFKRYVTSYLENLNVQEEIDDKLDRMLESGILTQYMQPYISQVTTEWLDENITEPTGVIIDRSLTIRGACADSESVGARFKTDGFTLQAKNELLALLEKICYNIDNPDIVVRNFERILLNGEDFYNTFYWSLSLNLEIARGGVDIDTSGVLHITTNQANSRQAIVTNRGRFPFIDSNNNETNYFPIPIPQSANMIEINWQPTTLYFNCTTLRYIGGNKYTRVSGGGSPWTSGGNITVNLADSNVKDRVFIINSKLDSGASTPYPDPPTNVTVTFSGTL